MDSVFAASMNPHVLTRTTSASSPSPRSSQPPAASRAASSSESTSLRAQPSVTRLTVRGRAGSEASGREGTPADYGTARGARAGSARRAGGQAGAPGGRRGDLHLLGRADAERHRLVGAGGLLLPVDFQDNPFRVAQAQVDRLGFLPALGR